MAHVCIGDSTVKVIYYKHTILNVYHVYMYGFRNVAIINSAFENNIQEQKKDIYIPKDLNYMEVCRK